MNTHLEVIAHKDQRYETVGDYWLDENGVRQFRCSDMSNEDFHFLVIIHELIEEHLTRRRGLKEEDIKAFDEMFEKERAEGKHSKTEEPGYDSRSPYLKEHTIASGIETTLAGIIGVDMNAYDHAVNSLSE